MTYKQQLENKINNISLSINEREDRFLDLQIYEIIEQEKKDNLIINEYKKEINFIFKNLNKYDYNFKFLEEENDHMGNYNCLIIVECESYNTHITNIFYLNDYNFINLMTLEQIKILKDYQEKNNEKYNDENESEF